MKKHWIIFLVSISIALYSCSKSDYGGSAEFYYINQSGTKIIGKTYSIYKDSSSFEIQVGDTMYYETTDPWFTEKKANPEEAFSPTGIFSDSVYITFDTLKYFIFSRKYKYGENQSCQDLRSVFCMDEYKIERIGDRHFRFYYNFTEADYKNAEAIKNK